jgi:hypothetical protein
MSSNQSLLQKADLALSDLTANGGALQPEEGSRFIRKLLVQPTMIRDCRVVEMNAPQRKINKIGFGSRILRKAQSGTALTESQRSKPTTEQLTLSTDEVIAEVHLPYDVLEDNIERAGAANNEASNTGRSGGLKNTLIDLIAERAALDLEELGLKGDTTFTSADQDEQDYLSMTNGWLKIGADRGNVVDASNTKIGKSIFKKGLQTMPDQYLRNRAAMRHYVSVDNEVEYIDTLADRPTGMGDSLTEGVREARAYGSPVRSAALMPDTKGLFTNPLNLVMGIQRNVSMEYDKDISRRVYKIVLTARIAFEIEEAEALVEYQNILEPLAA